MTTYADRVAETTATSGTGTLTLGGALDPTYQTFNSAFATGSKVSYAIYGGADWEVGFGTLTASTTLARDIVLRSSNANAPVNLAAISHVVFCNEAADMIADRGLTLAVGMCIIPQ